MINNNSSNKIFFINKLSSTELLKINQTTVTIKNPLKNISSNNYPKLIKVLGKIVKILINYNYHN